MSKDISYYRKKFVMLHPHLPLVLIFHLAVEVIFFLGSLTQGSVGIKYFFYANLITLPIVVFLLIYYFLFRSSIYIEPFIGSYLFFTSSIFAGIMVILVDYYRGFITLEDFPFVGRMRIIMFLSGFVVGFIVTCLIRKKMFNSYEKAKDYTKKIIYIYKYEMMSGLVDSGYVFGSIYDIYDNDSYWRKMGVVNSIIMGIGPGFAIFVNTILSKKFPGFGVLISYFILFIGSYGSVFLIGISHIFVRIGKRIGVKTRTLQVFSRMYDWHRGIREAREKYIKVEDEIEERRKRGERIGKWKYYCEKFGGEEKVISLITGLKEERVRELKAKRNMEVQAKEVVVE